jgi:hypothetical protein
MSLQAPPIVITRQKFVWGRQCDPLHQDFRRARNFLHMGQGLVPVNELAYSSPLSSRIWLTGHNLSENGTSALAVNVCYLVKNR